ncbi:cell wall integrity and stress response component 4-like isoform X2 [Lytechinus variegatus]|uniref:cell wall integrity and stress response component 4-like isoform X2 n=1 Tax=Lytechinus variegatus TaxID=7654 RepID=UPI001BB187EB|nr:cell wall integrity and stress response component 4-like isoform X2 [Lytechinus variegatus]
MASYIIHILLYMCLNLRLRFVVGQDYTYLGCFYDNNRREPLPDLIYCERDTYPYDSCQNTCGPQAQYCQSQEMTIELCRDICADQNMRYFGLQTGTQCLCGGFFASYNVRGQPEGNDTCNRPCSGNSSQMCGSDFQASVYQINESPSDCFNPGYVLNGDQSQQDSSFYNASDVIDFATVCPPPSIKDGATSITCTASGNWTNPPPTCTVRCVTPTAPMYANFSSWQTLNDNYAVDDEVFFDCDMDPSRTNQTLTCGYYGDWEPLPMMDLDCPETPPTTDGSTTTNVTATTPTTVSSTASVNDSTSSTTNETTTLGGPPTTDSTTMSVSTAPTSTDQTTSTSSSPSASPSSPSPSMTDDSTTRQPITMTSSPGGQDPSTPVVTDGGGGSTTVNRDILTGDDMNLVPIIVGVAAAFLVIILIIIVVSVYCSRKGRQKTKKIPFDPALGASFGNPAFEEDEEAETARRGFVQENDYGDRQTYDIGVSDYAMANDEVDRAPPDGKDSSVFLPDNGTEDVTYAVVNKNRQDAVEP